MFKKNLFTLSLGLLCLIASHLMGQSNKPLPSNRIIKIDYNKTAGALNTMFKECIGAGRANEGLRADWQKQLTLTNKECGFKYIRMHGLLSDDMGVYKEDANGNPCYNYQYIDALYDFLVSIKMKPFVELSFMPTALASGTKTIFWWKGNVTPPKDYKKWQDLIKDLTLHFTNRYGAEEVKTWYFEVWNEPNLKGQFWTSTQEEYFKLFDYTSQAIKSVNAQYKVGGPATAGINWVSELIDHCTKNAIPLDFISTHSYGVKQGHLDEFGKAGTILSKDPSSISGGIVNFHNHMANSPNAKLELHYTEWSSSYSPSDPFHDSYQSAAYILDKLKRIGNAANSMSYWVFTDIFEEAGPRFTTFHGGFGLLNIEGIKKPSYFSYYLLNKLGETELTNSDSSSYTTKSATGNIQVLFWNFKNTLPTDSTNDQSYFNQEIPSKPIGNVTIDLANIPKGKYNLEIYKVGYKVNDPFTSYILMGKPDQLTQQQVETIKQQNNGLPISSQPIIIRADGKFTKNIAINENDVFLVNIVKQ